MASHPSGAGGRTGREPARKMQPAAPSAPGSGGERKGRPPRGGPWRVRVDLGAGDNRVASLTPPSLRSSKMLTRGAPGLRLPLPPPTAPPPRPYPGVGLPSLSCGVPRFPIALHPENPKRNLGK